MSDDENSSEEGTSSSSSTSEDEELNEDFLEKDFLKTLSCLKNKDPQIYNKNVQFFPQEEAKLKKEPTKKKDSTEKPIYLRDYERDILIKEVNNEFEEHSDDQGEPPPTMTYNEEQRAIKESFKIIVNEESSEDEENATLLKKKEKDEKEKQQEDKDYIQWLKGKRNDLDDKEIENELKPLHDYWNDPSLDEKEEFLKDYILNKRYLERDAQGNVEESDLFEDEKLLEAQENFEHKYNFRLKARRIESSKDIQETLKAA
uniref:Protein KRI1 homolog n=1 Tax=Rhodnius prolixus TaxID=13249 RepID=T1HYH3_RHOPR